MKYQARPHSQLSSFLSTALNPGNLYISLTCLLLYIHSNSVDCSRNTISLSLQPNQTQSAELQWLVSSSLLVSWPEERLLVSSSPTRLLVRVPQRPEVSRSPIRKQDRSCVPSWDLSLPELHWAADPQPFLSATCQRNCSGFQDQSSFPVLRHHGRSRRLWSLLGWTFRGYQHVHYPRQAFMPLCPRISNWPEVFVKNVLKHINWMNLLYTQRPF